jgi:hypothetical protein
VSSDKIYLNREQQIFLTEMFEINDPSLAAEKFAIMMVEERANPGDLLEYIKKIMKRMK